MAFQLFRGHIGWSPSNTMARAGGRRAEPGNTKVGQQEVRAIGIFLVVADKKVGRFDILVDNLMVMGMLKGVSGLAYQIHHVLCVEWYPL